MIGEVLRLFRTIEGEKAHNFAQKLGISPSYLSLIESGKRQPSIELINKYADILGVRPSGILFFYEEVNDGEIKNSLLKMSRPLLIKLIGRLASQHK